jgi:hypothetical protein
VFLLCILRAGDTLTIPELMEEQRARMRSGVPAERFAAALLLSGVLARRLRELGDLELGQVLDREVCSNMSVLAPELTVCMETADRLCRRRTGKTVRDTRQRRSMIMETISSTPSRHYMGHASLTFFFRSRGTSSRATRSWCHPWRKQGVVCVRQDFGRIPALPRC